jgi:hypothetical protein
MVSETPKNFGETYALVLLKLITRAEESEELDACSREHHDRLC